jgi:hypothetical protein
MKEGAGGSRRLFKRLGGAGQRGGKRRGPCGRGRVAEGEGGEGAPCTVVGSAGWPATAPGHRAVVLSCNRGERQGTTDMVRVRLTSGAGTSRGPSFSGGVREGEG